MKLDYLRKKIDSVDEKILENLAERMSVVRKIKELKIGQGLPIENKKREIQVLENAMQRAEKLHLSLEFVSRLFKLIISESKKNQKKL